MLYSGVGLYSIGLEKTFKGFKKGSDMWIYVTTITLVAGRGSIEGEHPETEKTAREAYPSP